MKKNTVQKDNPEHRIWRSQVWANYHYGKMTTDEAQRQAGAEPPRWIEDDSHMADAKHQQGVITEYDFAEDYRRGQG